MIRFLLDTGMAGDLINRRHGVDVRARSELAKGNRIGIAVPVLAELAYGLELSSSREKNWHRLQSALAFLKVWPFDQVAAFAYGRIAAEARRSGRPMQVVDMMIAAIGLGFNDCTVVTGDSDLSAVPGLRIENWAV